MHQLEAIKVLQALTVTRYQLRLEELVEMLAVHFDPVHSRFESACRLLDLQQSFRVLIFGH
jgi:hypothetical protein